MVVLDGLTTTFIRRDGFQNTTLYMLFRYYLEMRKPWPLIGSLLTYLEFA